jgi:ribosomal protein S18 acetylase RimI-like enzyme
LVILPLGPEHRTGFALFACARYGEWWTKQIQEMIQTRLAESLEQGEVEAVGAWEKGDLCAIAAFTPRPGEWHISVLATRIGHQRHGYATDLARHIIELARSNGALIVTWFMHQDNEPMFKLGRALQGGLVPEPSDGTRLHYLCTVPLD